MTRALADMTPDERADCVGMWFEGRFSDLVILSRVEDEAACVSSPKGGWRWDKLPELTPRFDLPRVWTPTGEPVPGEWEDSPSEEHFHRWCARWEKKQDKET